MKDTGTLERYDVVPVPEAFDMYQRTLTIIVMLLMVSVGPMTVLAGSSPGVTAEMGDEMGAGIDPDPGASPDTTEGVLTARAVPDRDAVRGAVPMSDLGPRTGRSEDETPARLLMPSGRTGPDVAPRNITFNDTDPTWFGHSIGTVGEVTEIEAWISNIGTTNATGVGVRIEIMDFFDKIVGLYETIIADIPPGVDAQVLWTDWTPQFSAKIHARTALTLAGDVDQSNNNWTYIGTGWWVNKWLDLSDNQAGWTGDISATDWHITDSVQTDPDPSAHTVPNAWFAGTESGILGDFYTANMNVSLVSKSIDLKHMNPYYPAFINLKYYGAALPGDLIRMYVSIDDGGTWVDTRTTFSGITTSGGQPDWLVRVDNWVDLDDDGVREDGEFDYGIDISEFIGHDVRFRFTFTSGPTSTGLGYYLDDLIVYGFEAENEVALVRIGNLGTTSLNETEEVVASFWNIGIDTSPAMTARMTVEKNSVEVSHEDKVLDSIAAGSKTDVTWTFQPNETGNFEVQVSIVSQPAGSDSSVFNNRQTRRVHVSSGGAGILMVDDDGGRTNSGRLHLRNYETDSDYRFMSAIDKEIDVYHVLYNEEGPDLTVLDDYHTVIWSTGWDGSGRTVFGTLGPNDRANLRTFMDDGGSLWLMSQEAVFDLDRFDPSFLSQQLHVADFVDDAGIPNVIDTVEGNEVTGNMAMEAVVPIPANDRTDSIQPDAQAFGITFQDDDIQNTGTGPFNGIGFNGSHKMVYTSFDISNIDHEDDRAMFANAVIDWLYAGLRMRVVDPDRTLESGETLNYTIVISNHGSANRTVEELVITTVTAGWEAVLDPEIRDQEPESVLVGFESFMAYLLLTAPEGIGAGTKGQAKVRLVVSGTGEVLENTTRATVKETVKVNMTVSPKDQQADGGKNASYLITFRNVGNVKVGVNLSLNGTIDTWVSLDAAFLVLDPEENEGVVLTLSVPTDAEAGNYSLEVVAEARYKDIIFEVRDGFNVTVNQFQSLAIDSVRVPNGGQVDPESPMVNIMIEVDNKGNGPDLVNVSLSATFPDEDLWVWGSEEVLIPAFTKGFRTDITLEVWDEAPGGEYNITVKATSQDGRTYAEDHVILTVLRPDLYLTLEGISFDYDLVAGEEVSFKVKVFNGGDVDSPTPELTIYDNGGEMIFSGSIGSGVRAGGFSEMTVDWTPPYKGPEELTFYVNEDRSIVEMGYKNNSVTKVIQIFQPNLALGQADIMLYVDGKTKNKVLEKELVTITVQISNMDSYPYEAQEVVVEFYMDGALIGNKTTDIEAGNIAYLSVEWKAVKGLHTVKIKVDPLDKVHEFRENDNEATKEFMVREAKEKGTWEVDVDPIIIAAIIAIAVLVLVVYGIARGAIPSPMRKSEVRIADRRYKCNECGKGIKKGREYYHCACGARSHVKCAKRAELCECLKRVRIDD